MFNLFTKNVIYCLVCLLPFSLSGCFRTIDGDDPWMRFHPAPLTDRLIDKSLDRISTNAVKRATIDGQALNLQRRKARKRTAYIVCNLKISESLPILDSTSVECINSISPSLQSGKGRDVRIIEKAPDSCHPGSQDDYWALEIDAKSAAPRKIWFVPSCFSKNSNPTYLLLTTPLEGGMDEELNANIVLLPFTFAADTVLTALDIVATILFYIPYECRKLF